MAGPSCYRAKSDGWRRKLGDVTAHDSTGLIVSMILAIHILQTGIEQIR